MIAKGIILSLSGEKEDVIAGYIRQEGKQVYQLLDSCQEILLYDFDRQLGDIIHYNFRGQDFTARIVEEAYHEIKGITRRVLTIIFESQYASEIHYWAEGLGDLSNPFILWECITGEACEVGSGGVRAGGINCISDKSGVLYGDCPETCNIQLDTTPVFPTYEDQPVWCVKESDFFFNDLEFYYSLELLPDTAICGKRYNSLLAKDYIRGRPEFRDTSDIIVGYLRQEGQRVYQLLDSCQEFLLYDFSLEKGDTLVQTYQNETFKTVIQDTQFQNINGISRKAYSVVYSSTEKFAIGLWIEGLGDVLFPLIDLNCLSDPACEGAIGGRVNCITQENNVIYGDCSEACEAQNNTTRIDNFQENTTQLSLAYNPVTVGSPLEVWYVFSKNQQGRFYVTNSLGQVLHRQHQQELWQEGNIRLNWSPQVSGMYWLVWQSDTGQRKAVSFVVQ